MYTRLSAARSYVYAVARACDAGHISRRDCAGAILYSSDRTVEVTSEAMQSLGGNGYINEYPVARMLRDARLYTVGAGTQEIRRMLIGRTFNEGEWTRGFCKRVKSLTVLSTPCRACVNAIITVTPSAAYCMQCHCLCRALLLLLGSAQGRSNVLSPQFYAQRPLHLCQHLRVGLRLARLKLLNHLGLLVDALSQVLLRPPFLLTSLPDGLAYGGGNLRRGCHVVFAVQFGQVSMVCTRVALVGARRD